MVSRSGTLLVTTLAVACAVAPVAQAVPEPIAGAPVRLLGEQIIAHDLDFLGTAVGGLSGIDFQPAFALAGL